MSGRWYEGYLKPCGTEAACRRHKRRGEPVDEACRQASNQAAARRSKTRVHFRYGAGPGYLGGQVGYPACGRPSGAELTSDPAEVTCGQCQRTGLYRAAARRAA